MCGRYDNSNSRFRIPRYYKVDGIPHFTETADARPRSVQPIIRLDDAGSRECALALWWMIPPYTKTKADAFKLTTFNAKCETMATSAVYRNAFRRRRALVPASAVIEWPDIDPPKGQKKPKYRIERTDGELVTLAGLWDRWTDHETGEVIDNFTIVTTQPNALFQSLPHRRMPVILQPDHFDWWLDPTGPDPSPLFAPFPPELLTATQVSA